jgi:hypothetical protein
MTIEMRRIFKSASATPTIVKELIQIIFASELLSPSEEKIWLVSPWISNVEIFDNRSGNFSDINPDWGRTAIRLQDVIIEILKRNGNIALVSDAYEDEHNDKFFSVLQDKAQQNLVSDQITIIKPKNLHTKGFLFQHGFLSGSMNLTYNGLEIKDEQIMYDRDPEGRAQARVAFEEYECDLRQ